MSLFTLLGKTSSRDVDKLVAIREKGFALKERFGIPTLEGECPRYGPLAGWATQLSGLMCSWRRSAASGVDLHTPHSVKTGMAPCISPVKQAFPPCQHSFLRCRCARCRCRVCHGAAGYVGLHAVWCVPGGLTQLGRRLNSTAWGLGRPGCGYARMTA